MASPVLRSNRATVFDVYRIQDNIISNVIKHVAQAVFVGSLATIYCHAKAMASSSLLAKNVIIGFQFGATFLALNLTIFIAHSLLG
ncbi:MAG: hypothetical protein PVI40_03185 [Chlamydiota bacterium]|jgi:hypothetical protein